MTAKLIAELATALARAEAAPEKRAGGDPIFAPQFVSGLSTSGHLVNARIAENLATVLACVNAIASSIAGLPLCLYRRTTQGRIEDTNHPLNRLIIDGPNPYQTFPDFLEFLMASVLLRGNALAEVVTDAYGALTGLMPVPWEWVSVQMLPSGRLAYDVTEITSVYGGAGRMKRLLQGEVLHLRDRSDDGLLGRSRLQRAAASVGTALKMTEFVSSMYDNGARPSGVLKTTGNLDQESIERLRQSFQQAIAGPKNAAKTIVLEQGLDWQGISISPEDQELLASRRFSVEEMARIFGVPPVMIGDLSNSSFTNAETLLRYFAQFTLQHWTRKLEAEIARSIFSDTERASMLAEFDMSDLLRGDPKTRWETYKIAVDAQILDANEIREIEGYNPRPEARTTP